MYGIVFTELKRYVGTKLGAEAWYGLLAQAGLEHKVFMSFQVYPDADIGALVRTASAMTGLSATAILEDFGAFIAPNLIMMYPSLVHPRWKTLELIENTEQVMHTVVRKNNPGATPP